ncbi:MAG TPA: hypoxanthine-guanine phosphoribosyltransferase [Rhodanobacteraceae bacterium]|jgi:hypoxanthine phosphoribosyltransferase|nr:hypoxanthine-guanine phosphoribosyltransferase [Rhodanobacteraceae bacterium]
MSEGSHPLAEAMVRAERLHGRDSLDAAIARMGAGITSALDGERAVFLTVMNGGMFFAAPLALAIDGDLEFDYVHASRYRGDTVGHEVEWLHKPRVALAGRTVLLVDDILDEGYTLAALRDYCVAGGARRVLVVALCVKRHDRRVPGLEPDFFGVEVPDRYVFGYGLDYYGQGRNLPDIYALPQGPAGR